MTGLSVLQDVTVPKKTVLFSNPSHSHLSSITLIETHDKSFSGKI